MNKKNYVSVAITGHIQRALGYAAGLSVFLAMCLVAAAAAFLGNGSMFYEPLINAYVPPLATAQNTISGPADVAVARKYGRIDHGAVMAAAGDNELNPGPAAVAAYESPPH